MAWVERRPDVEIAARILVPSDRSRGGEGRPDGRKRVGGVVQRKGGGEEGVSRRGDWRQKRGAGYVGRR